jgi:hypothetical protein
MLAARFSLRAATLAAALGLGATVAANPAGAANIYLDVDAAELSGMSGVFTARDRMSVTGVDQMLFLGSPVGFPAADRVSIRSPFSGSSNYDFGLSYAAATQTFTYSLTNSAITGNVTGGSTGTLTYAVSGPLAFNILHIYASSSVLGSSVSFMNLTFNPGTGLTSVGALETAGGSSAGGTPTYDQWLAAPTGTNLALFDWSATARVSLVAGGTRPNDEGIKFEITGKTGEYTPPTPVVDVPAPAALALFGLGLAALGVARRRT